MRQRALELAVAIALCAAASLAQGQVYKCKDNAGKTTYTDAPCDAASKPLRLADPARQGTTDPNMCAQLQDELNRLSAEADRNAKAGRPQSKSTVSRGKTLTDQYADRCAGISRSAPK